MNRNLKIEHKAVPFADPFAHFGRVANPASYDDASEQNIALEYLYGALSGDFLAYVKTKYAERILLIEIGTTCSQMTGHRWHEGKDEFMRLTDEIQQAFRLEGWRPESLMRAIRKDRAESDADDQQPIVLSTLCTTK